MTDWVAQDDWSLLKLHDLVRVTRDDGMLTGEIVSIGMNGHGRIVLSAIGTYTSIEINLRDWQLSVPAKPAVELPTELGSVITWKRNGIPSFAYIDASLLWDCNGVNYTERDLLAALRDSEIVRMEPVAVTAKKVLDQMQSVVEGDYSSVASVISDIRKEFGVTDD